MLQLFPNSNVLVLSEELWKRPRRRNYEEETKDQKEKQHFLRATLSVRHTCKTVTLHLYLGLALQLLYATKHGYNIFLRDSCKSRFFVLF